METPELHDLPELKAGDRLSITSQCSGALNLKDCLGVTRSALRQAFVACDSNEYHEVLVGETEPVISEIFTDSWGVSIAAMKRGHNVYRDYSLHLGDDILDRKIRAKILRELRRV